MTSNSNDRTNPDDGGRLDELGDRIDAQQEELAEDQAGGDGPKFHESGTIRPDLDDQTIAPPA